MCCIKGIRGCMNFMSVTEHSTNTLTPFCTYVVISRSKGERGMSTKPKIKLPKTHLIKRKSTRKKKISAKQVRNPGFSDPTFFPWRSEGEVYLSTLRPNIGTQSAFFVPRSGRSASLTQRVTLEQPGPTGRYRLFYSVLVDRQNDNGVFQVSLLNTAVSRTTRLSSLPQTNYQTLEIIFSDADVRGQSSVDLEFRVNSGSGTRAAFLLLDTVVILPI